MVHRRSAAGLLSALIFVAVAHAPLAAQARRGFEPRVEVGLSGVFLSGFMDVSDFVADPQMGLSGPGASVRVNMGERFALEMSGVLDHVDDVRLLYYEASVIIKPRTREAGRWFHFIKLGAGGHHEFARVDEFQRENQDYSITVYPAYDHHKLTAPNFFVGGAGLARVVSRRLAVIGEIDGVIGAVGLGLRASAGVLLPLGVYRPR